MNRALIVVDLQQDFCKNGSLEVKDSDEIIPVINELISKFELVIFTKDWHPQDHISFASNHENKKVFETIILEDGTSQVLWPDHCVQHSLGSEFHENLNLENCYSKQFYIFKKGLDKNVDSYSAFYDNNHKNSTELSEFLHEKNIDQVLITGLALDYCVKYTAIDANNEGFDTIVILDACKSVNPDISETIKELTDHNIKMIESWELPLIKLM